MPGWIQRSLIIAGSLAVATVLVGAGLKLYSLRGSPDVMTRMVPSNTDVYATVYLDPSLKQKMNLRGLLGKFPQLRSNGGIDAQLDRLMNSFLEQSRTGWSFRSDVRPWLGSQVGLIVRVVDGEPHS